MNFSKTTFSTACQLLRWAGTILSWGPAAGKVCVINYHRVLLVHDPLLESEPDLATFRWQMELLSKCFNVMSLNDALVALDSDKVPPRAVCITFDDGYRSIHDLALPILREFNLPATVFVTSGHVDQGNMWNDRIIEAVQALPNGELDLSSLDLGTYPLHNINERQTAVGVLTEHFKYLPPAARRIAIEFLAAKAGTQPAKELMLTSEMIHNLDRNGIEIGAHTVSHPILTSLNDDNARQEIVRGKRDLETILGKSVRLFAYPNGKTGKDFDERHVAMVREAGFDAAFTTEIGSFSKTHDRYQLQRSRPWDQDPLRFGMRLLYWLSGPKT